MSKGDKVFIRGDTPDPLDSSSDTNSSRSRSRSRSDSRASWKTRRAESLRRDWSRSRSRSRSPRKEGFGTFRGGKIARDVVNNQDKNSRRNTSNRNAIRAKCNQIIGLESKLQHRDREIKECRDESREVARVAHESLQEKDLRITDLEKANKSLENKLEKEEKDKKAAEEKSGEMYDQYQKYKEKYKEIKDKYHSRKSHTNVQENNNNFDKKTAIIGAVFKALLE